LKIRHYPIVYQNLIFLSFRIKIVNHLAFTDAQALMQNFT